MDLVEEIYKVASSFPKNEEYGFAGQMKRAAISIPSNIGKGAARKSKKEFIQFLYFVSGSASQIDTQLELAYRLGYLPVAKNLTSIAS